MYFISGEYIVLVTSIGSCAFRYCESLTSLVIPNNVTRIGHQAFHSCINLQSITLPFVGTSINKTYDNTLKYVFGNSIPTSLKKVIITGDTQIWDSAFTGCNGIESIEILNSIGQIGSSAFYNCSSLVSIVIPESVTRIGFHAFAGCDSLTIYCEAKSKPLYWDTNWNSSNRPVVWGYKK